MNAKENKSGYFRVWLHAADKQALLEYYADDPIKQVAIRLMLESGLRVEEVPRVTANDLQYSEDGDYHQLKVREAKRGRRDTVVPVSLAQQIRTVSNIQDGGVVVEVTPRTVRNWVYEAAEALREETGEPDWGKVSPHDLRRSWATGLIQSGVPESDVMDYGGWENYETFRDHYYQPSEEQRGQRLKQVEGF